MVLQCGAILDLVWDSVIVLFSLFDIVCDVLIAHEYYKDGRMELFTASCIIFCTAQVSYSLLFTMLWGSKWSVRRRVLLFFLIIPVAQLVPFFFWFESLHFEWMDKMIRHANLKLSRKPPKMKFNKKQKDGKDALWLYLESKFNMHCGFLVEGLVEAVPQAILQTIGIIIQRDSFGNDSVSWLSIFSILMSLSVIASKGYLVAYSIDSRTFIFNLICVMYDVCSLFATATWLFSTGGNLMGSALWWSILRPVLICGVGVGVSVLILSILDDAIKLLRRATTPAFRANWHWIWTTRNAF